MTYGILVELVWGIQLVVCLVLGYKTAKKTGRSVLNWLAMGFGMAIIFPPIGIVIALVAFFFYPPAMPKTPKVPTADDDERRRRSASRHTKQPLPPAG